MRLMEAPAAMTKSEFGLRDGETALSFDPAESTGDAHIVYIGKVRSTWTERAECPKNMIAARERGQPATLILSEPYWPGLAALEGTSHAILLTWMDRAPRNVILQNPQHHGAKRGVFSIRSPARPNPIGLHVVKIEHIDEQSGTIMIDAIDVLDGTPFIDLKPYFASTDSVPEAITASRPKKD